MSRLVTRLVAIAAASTATAIATTACSPPRASAEAPATSVEPSADASVPVPLEVTADGRYVFEGRVMSLDALDVALQALKARAPEATVRVFGSEKVAYEQIAPAMAIVRRHGLARFGVVGASGVTP